MGSTARSYLSLMASLSSLASIKSFHGVDITITYNDRFEPTETVSKLINTVSGSTRYAIADAHSVSSFFSIDGEAPGTAVIARDSYTEVKDLPLAARLGQKINKMFFGDEGTVNLNMTTDLGTSSGNKDITYALVINDICKGEFELTERDKNNKPYLYVYEDGELSRGTGNPDGTASFDGEAKVETNISVAFQNIKAITDPLTFNLNFVSKIEEEYSRYTVYLDNSALAQVGLNYTEDYKGSTISYSFNVTNGEITNLTALVEIYYQDEFLMSIEYRYSFGIDPDAPPLTR